MILEPRKSAEEIDRRLSALNDPELAALLRRLNPASQTEDDLDSYTSPFAPYWKRRIGFVALAGLLAMSAGYGYTHAVFAPHPNVRATRAVAATAPRQRPKTAARRIALTPRPAEPAHHRMPIAPVLPASVPAPHEALIRQARAQLVHGHAIAVGANAEALHAQREADLARRAEAMAKTWAQAEALAQARAEALARAQANSAEIQRTQDQELQNASDPDIKPGDAPPPGSGSGSMYPSGSNPMPIPGPVDTNCTPHRGSFLTSALDRVRLGGTSVGGLLRLVNP